MRQNVSWRCEAGSGSDNNERRLEATLIQPLTRLMEQLKVQYHVSTYMYPITTLFSHAMHAMRAGVQR